MRQAHDKAVLHFALPRFDIRRAGRPWLGREEVSDRLSRLGDCKVEIVDGRLFGDEYQRRLLLGMLLENVGLDAAVTLAERRLWIQALDSAQHHNQSARPRR
ncbi:hypothetical protein [Haliangium sp. UPWRP_2]|uniref:hypothetical protein n=1 Tax=Haliangium sp. UPWRP_2 TaxID=1931276 RepID=UPI000B5415A1|nr:hypothetical protein [Haliangium sp. UPWRP_2]PSM31013.1 hypothetical protein BVG81_007585 [Haliangium sp. UPWRP_2]